MKRLWPPTPATVIACVALFVALGGGAYAAGLITSQDVKNNSLRGIDVKNNSLSARDINEATLPGLPRLVKPFDLTNGQSKVMVRSGPLKLTARCDINVGGNDTARILISTTQNNSSFDANDETDDLDTNTPATDRDFGADVTVATGTTEVEANVDDGVAIAPNGRTIHLVSAYSAVNAPFAAPGTCSFSGSFVVG